VWARCAAWSEFCRAPTRTGVGGGGRDRNATGAREGCNPRCQISEIRNSLKFAYDATLNRWARRFCQRMDS
jgi:hypothetical protein